MDLKIETDFTSVTNAEEALELPPIKRIDHELPEITQYAPENTRKNMKKLQIYDQIGAEDFDDCILFKHRRQRNGKQRDDAGKHKSDEEKHKNDEEKRGNQQQKSLGVATDERMSKSASSLSSTSSEEKEDRKENVSLPTLMNLSTIGLGSGLFPDLRSPETLLTDIEAKEKLLEDVLSLKQFNFSFEAENLLAGSDADVEEEQEEEKVKVDEVNVGNVDRNRRTVAFSGVKSNALSYGPPSGSSNPCSLDIPACVDVPNVWDLEEIVLGRNRLLAPPPECDAADISLGDWEII